MLLCIFCGPFSQIVSVGIGILPPNGIHFMVSKNHLSRPAVHHAANNRKGLTDLLALVDDIADEHRLSGGVGVSSVSLFIAQLFKKFLEESGVSVDVANDVVGLQLKGI